MWFFQMDTFPLFAGAHEFLTLALPKTDTICFGSFSQVPLGLRMLGKLRDMCTNKAKRVSVQTMETVRFKASKKQEKFCVVFLTVVVHCSINCCAILWNHW